MKADRRSPSEIVSSGLQDDDACPLRNRAFKPSHHSARCVTTDARVDDVDVKSPRAKHGLKLGWIRLARGDALAGGVASPKRYDSRGMSEAKLQEQPARSKRHKRFGSRAHLQILELGHAP